MEKNVKTIHIDLKIKPSKDLGKKVVTSLLDFLLHQRSQIPFPVELFKKFVETKTDDKLKDKDALQKRDWKTEKQLKDALETYDKICAMKQIIELEYKTGTPLLLLFGSTVHTAKEAYEIMFPKVNEILLPTLVNETAIVKTILLRIVQNQDLKCDKHQLPATNVFVLFKRPQSIVDDNPDLMIELRNFKLTKSCRKYLFKFSDSSDFDVFDEDFQELSLCEKPQDDSEEFWYQSKTYVKGFKDILVNNKSIWN